MIVGSAQAFLLRCFLLLVVIFAAALASGCRTSPSYAPYENLPHGPGG